MLPVTFVSGTRLSFVSSKVYSTVSACPRFSQAQKVVCQQNQMDQNDTCTGVVAVAFSALRQLLQVWSFLCLPRPR